MDKAWIEMYETVVDYANDRIMTLGELTPEWWID